MKKFLLLIFVVILTVLTVSVANAKEDTKNQDVIEKQSSLADMTKYIAAAIAIGTATISSGLAIGRIGSAAMGAVSERPEAGGTAIILAALAEGVCLWGFLIAFFILQ